MWKNLLASSVVIFSNMASGAGMSFIDYAYDGKIAYQYHKEISPKSKIINDSLTADVNALLAKLKSENKEITYLDKRALANKFFMEHSGASEAIATENFSIVSEVDGYKIPVRLYKSSRTSDKLIIFIHGGGWMQGNLDTHDYLCRKIAKIFEYNVLAVDYRLAPEYKFPFGLNDAFSVYKWCVNASKLAGINKIYISGDSGGGNLSAALNLKVQKEYEGHKPDGLILFYPALSNDVHSSSFKIFGNQAALTAASTAFFAEQYVGKKLDDPEVLNNELMFPIHGDAKAYPKTLIVAAECDVLIDCQLELFYKLKQAAVPVSLVIAKGAVHGFMGYGKEYDDDITGILFYLKQQIEK